MNIVLIPHNGTRHVAVAFMTGAVPLMIWWFLLNWLVLFGPSLFEMGLLWAPQAEGPILFMLMAAGLAGTHIAAEGGLRRRALAWRIILPLIAGLLAAVLTVLCVVGVELGTGFALGFVSGPLGDLYANPSTVTLRHRLLEWVLAGSCVGIVTLLVRVVWSYIGALAPFIPESLKAFLEVPPAPARVTVWMTLEHLLGGPASALLGASVWQILSHLVVGDMYLASALGFTMWGFSFGLIAWGVPSDLYAGWVRVLSAHRYGHRIPIDALDGGVVERVVGHYPRGLDLWVGADHGVAELHASFVRASDGKYTVRGLSQQPVMVKRSLESINLAYEPASPVPLETDLRMEDRVILGPKGNETVIEFIMLPKEER